MITIPKAQYKIGDRVSCNISEAGCPPSFEATVIGIKCGICGEPAEYTLAEDDGMKTDGYTEKWLTPSAHNDTANPSGGVE